MVYDNISTKKQLDIDKILFVQIHDYNEEHGFPQGIRSGDFWELLYVEKGLMDISSPSSTHTLSGTGLLLRHPSETFRIHVQNPAPAKLISIGFTCTEPCSQGGRPGGSPDGSPALNFLRGRPIPTGPSGRGLLRHVVTEAASGGHAAPFASGQLAATYLELLLILLIRNGSADVTLSAVSRSGRAADEDGLFRGIVAYMGEHIAERLTIGQICRDNLVGRALLQKLFSRHAGCGVIDYFSLMKINAAKRLIREGTLNFTQIAERLGYNSIHYFSRQFKAIAGITPSEYAAGIPDHDPPQGKL